LLLLSVIAALGLKGEEEEVVERASENPRPLRALRRLR
jgi:hypothetical protein